MTEPKTRVLLALPNYSGEANADMMMEVGGAREYCALRGIELRMMNVTSSGLTQGFNGLWGYCVNHPEMTHFIMLHSDVVPKDGMWFPKLLALSDETGADFISVVSPLKMPTGQTSNALVHGHDYGMQRRLTMREVMKLPLTFDRLAVAKKFGWDPKDCSLLINTGMLCISLKNRDILVDKAGGGKDAFCFDTRNLVRWNEKGEYYAIFWPEDWEMSMWAQDHGLSVWATRAIPLTHNAGGIGYDNDKAWGSMNTDIEDKRNRIWNSIKKGGWYAKEKEGREEKEARQEASGKENADDATHDGSDGQRDAKR